MARKNPIVFNVYANASASIGDLRRHPKAILEEAKSHPVVIFERNQVAGYVVSADAWARAAAKLAD